MNLSIWLGCGWQVSARAPVNLHYIDNNKLCIHSDMPKNYDKKLWLKELYMFLIWFYSVCLGWHTYHCKLFICFLKACQRPRTFYLECKLATLSNYVYLGHSATASLPSPLPSISLESQSKCTLKTQLYSSFKKNQRT